MEIQDFLSSINWTVAGNFSIPASDAEYFTLQDIKLSNASKKLLKTFEKGIYLHQKEAIRNAIDKKTFVLAREQRLAKPLHFT